jgi:FlaA1/EpsC-like NDP-sugar epimerase/8-oxo-dGTP pyrophosphatase MutT (NUDIX family)
MPQSRFAGYVTKVLILGIDLLFSLVAISLALFVEVNYDFARWMEYMFYWGPWVLLIMRAIGFVIFKTYLIIIRYVGEKDIWNLVFAVTSSSTAFTAFMYFNQTLLPPGTLSSILILDYFILLFLAGGFRIILRIFYNQMRARNIGSRLNTVIYGAGEMGAALERVLQKSVSHKYKVVAFFDDNPRVHKKFLNGIPIYNPEKVFDPVMKNHDVQVGIIAIKNLPDSRRIKFINRCLDHKVKVMKVPPTSEWLNNRLNVGQLQQINFEDLLNRPAIDLDKDRIEKSIHQKVILVSGCAGSIGSEIVHQLMQYKPLKIIGVDQAESPLAELCRIYSKDEKCTFQGIVGDVRDVLKMEMIFEEYQPDLVYHAAAYKHVPIMEAYPEEAIKANVKGTTIISGLASKYEVEKFVMISTDKVVNPANIMGASKRIAEIFIQSLNEVGENGTQFITTRFGNVLGSNGSVIPIFKHQIQEREPVTVTHPQVTRFFMTIPEACQLVLEAGAMGEGGEIYVFDMGEPVKIDDLARKMIKMAGLTVGEDVEIKYTGLRPGEKLFEELLDKREGLQPTHHKKILKAAVRPVKYESVQAHIEKLIHLAESGSSTKILVEKISELVPEYTGGSNARNQKSIEDSDPAGEDNHVDILDEEEGSYISETKGQAGVKNLFLRTLGKVIPSDLFSNRYPVSVKGVCFINDKVVLVKNERAAWDLPGGKLKSGEDLETCLKREFKEEVNIEITPLALHKVIPLKVMNAVNVIVVIFYCTTTADEKALKHSQENFGVGTFVLADLPQLDLPEAYIKMIEELSKEA